MHAPIRIAQPALVRFALVASLVSPTFATGQVPCPDGRPPCADVCCAVDDACRFGTCHTPGGDCALQDDCPQDAFCDPVLASCLPREALPPCEYRPPVGQFDPVVEWGWHGSPILPDFRNVMMTPAVISLTDDNGDGLIDGDDVPDVVFTTYVSGGSHAEEGVLRAVSGDDGHELFTADGAADRVNGLSSLAVGDLDGDGRAEIVTSRFAGQGVVESGVQAFEHDGTPKWKSDAPYPIGWGAPALADLDGDGTVEVVVGRVVLDGMTGVRKCQAQGEGGNGSANQNRPIPVVADLEGDGFQEIVTGNAVYEHDCRTRWALPAEHDGFTAVADFNLDGTPEIAVVYSGGVRIQDVNGRVIVRNEALIGATDPGGAPTIADFDGDGRPELATAGSTRYVVLKPAADLSSLPELWSVPTQDGSSRVTGSSVFDFEGDGAAEVVYNDECYVRVMSGRDGTILFQTENSSSTTCEYPLIVDVDRDGQAEIVAIANGNGSRCPWAGQAFEPGIRVFADRRGNWVGTRRLWNQHAYSVTNICDGTGNACDPADDRYAGIPRRPVTNWRQLWLDNFRQNVQGAGIFDAPDLVVVAATAELAGCPVGATITATVFNQGSEEVPPGAVVALLGAAGETLATAQTAGALPPGGTEEVLLPWPDAGQSAGQVVALTVVVDPRAEADPPPGPGEAAGAVAECQEENNALAFMLDVPAEGEPLNQTPCPTGLPGRCALGRLVCLPDGEACVPENEPEPEICNSLDDDCDGTIDEDLRNACGRCGAPPAETCDGADDDCDGVVDDDAPCPPGDVCRFARCISPCLNDECPGDDICFEGYCVHACDLAECGADMVCEDGACHDPCVGVACVEGEVCHRGACVPDDCHATGCPEGQICGAEGCRPDPCAGIACAPGDFCRDGLCVPSCAAVSCAADERCVDGACVDDPCAGVVCPDGQRCAQGVCGADPCTGIDCGPYRQCVDGVCSEDACTGVECPPGEACTVTPEGAAQCAAAWAPDAGGAGPGGDGGEPGSTGDAAPPSPHPGADAAGFRGDAGFPIGGGDVGAGEPGDDAQAVSEGCACRTGRPGAPGPMWLTLLAIGGLVRRRRR